MKYIEIVMINNLFQIRFKRVYRNWRGKLKVKYSYLKYTYFDNYPPYGEYEAPYIFNTFDEAETKAKEILNNNKLHIVESYEYKR